MVRKSYLTYSFVTIFHCTQNRKFSRDIIFPNIDTPFFHLSKGIIYTKNIGIVQYTARDYSFQTEILPLFSKYFNIVFSLIIGASNQFAV